MKRLKTFLLYALAVAALWIFSNVIIYISLNSTYKNINAKIYTNSPQITILKNQATYVNGVINGSIKNNTQEIINDKYLKIDLYSARDVKLGTKYVKIENLEPDKSKDFEMGYRFTNVDYATLTITDNANNATEEEFMSQETNTSLIIGTLLILYFI